MNGEDGYFTISGVFDYGYTVDARQYSIGTSYYFRNKGFPTLDERFQVCIDGSGTISGNFRVKDKYDSFYSGNDIGTDLYRKLSKLGFPPCYTRLNNQTLYRRYQEKYLDIRSYLIKLTSSTFFSSLQSSCKLSYRGLGLTYLRNCEVFLILNKSYGGYHENKVNGIFYY